MQVLAASCEQVFAMTRKEALALRQRETSVTYLLLNRFFDCMEEVYENQSSEG